MFEEAVSNVDAMLAKWPDDLIDAPFAHHVLALAHHSLGDESQAEWNFAEAIRLDPEEPRWLLGRARSYDEAGKPDLAAEDRRKAEKLRAAARPLDPAAATQPVGGPSPPGLDPRN